MKQLIVGVFVMLGCATVHAEVNAVQALRTRVDAKSQCRQTTLRSLAAEVGEKVNTAAADFEALGFGGGYAALVSLGDESRVEEAEVVNGLVRVKKDNDVQFGPVLEMHKFVWPLRSQTLVKVGNDWVLATEAVGGCIDDDIPHKSVPLIAAAPFVTVRVGGNDVVQSFGVGVMFGFRTAESDKSLNFGLAYVTDPSVKTLGDGIEDGSALPTGETQIRYKNTHQEGIMVLFSVGW